MTAASNTARPDGSTFANCPAVLGIDFGGTVIKAAPVDLETGRLTAEPIGIDTPRPATPELVADVVEQLVRSLDGAGAGPIGVAVPGVVRRGVLFSAANIDPSWIGLDAEDRLTQRLGRPAHVLNDADAAGGAEVHYGAARDETGGAAAGLVLVTTLGTGIGSALVYDGVVVPNTEFGHLELGGHVAEKLAATSAREREGLSYERWAARLTRYFQHLERLLNPDLIVVGGGVSQSWAQFGHLIHTSAPIKPAALGNRAGIVGAARVAASATTTS